MGSERKGIKGWLADAGLINDIPSDSLAPWTKDDEYFRALVIFVLALLASPFIIIAVVAIS